MIKLISPTTQDQIMDLPLHIEIDIGSEKYLLAHAMTFAPLYREQEETMYLEGIAEMQKYWQYGIKGYVSLIGHHDSAHLYTILISKQTYLRPFNTNKDRIKENEIKIMGI